MRLPKTTTKQKAFHHLWQKASLLGKRNWINLKTTYSTATTREVAQFAEFSNSIA